MNRTKFVPRTGIFLSGALGDFINALPALYLLRERLPSDRIELVGNPSWVPLARAAGVANHVRSMEELPLHAAFQPSLGQNHPLYRFLASFDRIISWFGDKEGLWRKHLQNACHGEVHLFPLHQYHSFKGHVSEYYLSSLQGIGIKDQEQPPCTRTRQYPLLRNLNSLLWKAPQKALVKEAAYLCIHPGSGSPLKNWPQEYFLHVSRSVHLKWGLPSVILLGPAEASQREFWTAAEGEALTIKENLSLVEISSILSHATLYLGNDSGITHLSAALGVPLVALFGPSDPLRWAPLGPLARVIHKALPCAPCHGSLPSSCKQPECIRDISHEEVLNMLQGLRTDLQIA